MRRRAFLLDIAPLQTSKDEPCLKKVAIKAFHQLLSNATTLRLAQWLRRIMRNTWLVLTRAETIFLIAGLTLIAGGGIWAEALPA